VSQAIPLQQQHRAEHARDLALDEPAERRQDFGQRLPDRDHLEDVGLAGQEGGDAVALTTLPDVSHAQGPEPEDRQAPDQGPDHDRVLSVAPTVAFS
jgi:hypothetical protein